MEANSVLAQGRRWWCREFRCASLHEHMMPWSAGTVQSVYIDRALLKVYRLFLQTRHPRTRHIYRSGKSTSHFGLEG